MKNLYNVIHQSFSLDLFIAPNFFFVMCVRFYVRLHKRKRTKIHTSPIFISNITFIIILFVAIVETIFSIDFYLVQKLNFSSKDADFFLPGRL